MCAHIKQEVGCALKSPRFLSPSSSSPPPPPPAPVCDWLVTVLNNFNWLASAVGGSQTSEPLWNTQKSVLISDLVGSKDSLLRSERVLEKHYLHLFNSAHCSVSCLVPAFFSSKIWKWSSPSFHNLSTPFFGFELDSLSSLPLALFPGLPCLMGFVLHQFNWCVTHIQTHVHDIHTVHPYSNAAQAFGNDINKPLFIWGNVMLSQLQVCLDIKEMHGYITLM